MANPYNNLIDIMRKEGSHNYELPFYFAIVTSSYPDLKVKFDNTEVEKEMLLMDSFLLQRQKQITTESNSSHAHTINTLKDLLRVGDRVILVRDGERFVILSKVVKL